MSIAGSNNSMNRTRSLMKMIDMHNGTNTILKKSQERVEEIKTPQLKSS